MALSRRFAVLALGATVLLTGLVAAPAPAVVVSNPLPSQLRPDLVGDAAQIVVVAASKWSSTSAKLTFYERRSTGWKRVAGPYYARIGRNGMKVDHVEGDGTTPAGSFPLVSAFGLSKNPGTKLAYRKLGKGDCWISDPNRPDYNTLVVQQPCGAQNEDLWSIARRGAYRKAVVTGYNIDPIVAGKGSAIFLHLHSRTAGGATRRTSGCVTLTDFQLTYIMRRLDPTKRPRVVLGPASWLVP